MPSISMFYGVIVYLYFYDNKEHKVPHIHATYQEHKCVFAIETGEIIAGEIPNNKSRLVQAWIEIHRDELMANWTLAIAGDELFRIEPLK